MEPNEFGSLGYFFLLFDIKIPPFAYKNAVHAPEYCGIISSVVDDCTQLRKAYDIYAGRSVLAHRAVLLFGLTNLSV